MNAPSTLRNRRRLEEFLNLPRTKSGQRMSRQQRYILRQRQRGLCRCCPKKARPGSCFCSRHQNFHREAARRRKSTVKRYKKASSYAGNWKWRVRQFEKKRGPSPEFPEAGKVIPDAVQTHDPFVPKR